MCNHTPAEESNTNLSNYGASLINEGALIIHLGSSHIDITLTCGGQVIKREDLEIPTSFYVVNKGIVQDTPMYMSSTTNVYDYRVFLYCMRYSREEIDRVIEISSGANIKGD